MTQRQLNIAVAHVTGESRRCIADLGFNLADPLVAAYEGGVLVLGRGSPRNGADVWLREILESGVDRGDRTGTGTRSLFGRQLRFDLEAGFPLLTTKRLHVRSILYELLWFLRGETNIAWLKERGVTTVGVDTPSVDLFDSKKLEAHNAFLRHDISIIEGLVLKDVADGMYELIALPLKLVGYDGSPVRAVLRRA
jgi:hypothetical protein